MQARGGGSSLAGWWSWSASSLSAAAASAVSSASAALVSTSTVSSSAARAVRARRPVRSGAAAVLASGWPAGRHGRAGPPGPCGRPRQGGPRCPVRAGAAAVPPRDGQDEALLAAARHAATEPRPSTDGSSAETRCALASASPIRPPPACCASSAAKASARPEPPTPHDRPGRHRAGPPGRKQAARRPASRPRTGTPDRFAVAAMSLTALAGPGFCAQRAWFAGLPPPSPSGAVLTAERGSAVRAGCRPLRPRDWNVPGQERYGQQEPAALGSRQLGPPLAQGVEPRAQVPRQVIMQSPATEPGARVNRRPACHRVGNRFT
jgi:hypothetical protein